LEFEEISLKANYMLIDLTKNEVFATYSLDKDSNRIGSPVFTDGSETIDAASIRYNFDTKKGYIQEVKIKQDENYLYMEVAKRQQNEEVHFKQGRFTTCDLEEPHFHFQLSRAILIPEKRIVSGPMNLWIKGVPTPIGLPFIFIPQKKQKESDRKHGVLFPQFVPFSPYGIGIQDIGYYLPINDSIHTTFRATAFTRGSWGVGNRTEYLIKYKFTGALDLRYDRFSFGFPQDDVRSKISVMWNHRQDPKANPLWNFGASINFQSDNNPKNNLDPLNPNYFNNSFNSDINVNRSFPGKPVTMGMKASMRQNSVSKNFVLNAPTFNVNVTRFSPFNVFFDKDKAIPSKSQKFLSQIGMTYNLEAQNAATFGDSLLTNRQFDAISRQFMNGISQQTTIQTTLSLFDNTWKLTPSINYSNKTNFQQTRKSYDEINNATLTDTIQQVGMAQNLSANVSLTTVVYSYYRFVGKKQPLLRHLLTPSFGFRYVPLLNSIITDSVGVNKQPLAYSPFERSIYAEGATNTAALLTFGFNNTFELKRKSEKDTITGFRKTRLIDGFSITGNYDLNKDSMRFSPISTNLRISPFEFLNFVAEGSFSPYAWDSTGKMKKEYAINSNQGLGRFMNISFNTNFVITSPSSRKKLEETKENITQNWNSDYQFFAMNPYQLIDFEIPWKVTFGHNWSFNANTFKQVGDKDYTQIQTIIMNGDISLTKRWKLIVDANYSFEAKKITNTRMTLSRNMHCWNLSFFWIPVGGNQSFVFRLNATSSLFQTAKVELRNPPQLF
jgi:hypothetical protein